MVRRICLVEDDLLCVFLVRKVLEKHGVKHTLQHFNNGKPAVEWLETAINEGLPLPELILLDLHMPDMNGWDFLEQWSTNKPSHIKIPVYVLSSSINHDDMERAKRYAEVADYLVKPFDTVHLSKILSTNPQV